MAEEQKDIVEGLLHLLHAKYLKEDSSTLIHKGPEFEELCRRLTISEIPLPFPSGQELSRPASEEDCDRNDEDIEVSQSHQAEAPTDEPQQVFAPQDATTYRNESSLALAPSKPIRQTYPVHIPFKKLAQSSRDKCAKFEAAKHRSHSQKNEAKQLKEKKRPKGGTNCGNCRGCEREEDCGECGFCRDKPKFGGPGIQKQKCELKWCKSKNSRKNSNLAGLRQKDILVDDKTNSKENSIFFKAGGRSNEEFEGNGESSKRVAREASKQSAATQQNNRGGRHQTNPVRRKVREFFITRDKKEELQDEQRDPEYTPEASHKRMKRPKPATSDPVAECGPRQLLKCFICGKVESRRSHLYGHYARSHFRDQLIEQIGAKRKNCGEHNVMLKGEAHVAAHFGGVHNMVEEFLPHQYQIPSTSQGLSMTKTRYSGQNEAALEKTEERAKKNNEDIDFAQWTEDSYSPNHFFEVDEAKRCCIQLGSQKRDKREDMKSNPEEEYSSDNEELVKVENKVEEQAEHGEDGELYDLENGNNKEDSVDSIDVKDNILAYKEDKRSPRTLLSELEFSEESLDSE